MKQVTGPSYKIFQQGFSMVELMVAMVLSLVLIIGIIQVFNSSKQTYRTQDDIIQIQENGRFALDILERHIRMADFPNTNIMFTGSTPYRKLKPVTPVKLVSMYPALQGGSPVRNNAITGTYGTGNNPDSIIIRYNASTDPCGGATTGLTTYRFFIKTDPKDPTKKILSCDYNTPGSTTALTADDAVLIKNVVNMQIQYGIDGTTAPAPTTVTRYEISPNSTTLERVVSVRIALLIRGNTPTTGSCNKSYTLLDPLKKIPTADCYLYKVIQTTIRLRNRLNRKA